MTANGKMVQAVRRAAMGACALLLAAGLTGCALTTPSLSEVEPEQVEATLTAADLVEEGCLTVAMDASDAPQALTDNEGKPSGYYADLARAFAQRMGLKLKVVSAANAADSVGAGKADLFMGARATDASDGIAVTGSVVENASAIFAKTADGSKEVPTLSADALVGKTIGVQDASASQDALVRNGIEAEQKTYENVNKCFDALAAGEVDYVACDATAGSYLSRAYPGTVFVATISTVSSYGIAMPNENTALAESAAEIYEELISDGTIDAIHKQWYGGMPLALSDTLLSGVTLASADESQDGEAAEGEDGEPTVSDGINSIG